MSGARPLEKAWARARGRAAVALLLGGGLLCGDAGAASGNDGAACAGAEPALQSAREALDRGEWAEAEQRLEPLSASHPDCGGVVLGLARLRAARGDAAEAERLFTRATALAPRDARGHALFAEYWLSRGQRARADYLSELAHSLDPDNPEALVVKGRIASLRGQVQVAHLALQKAASLGPTNAEAHYRLGVLLFGRQLHREAVRSFERAVALRPLDARARDYLALGFEMLGDAEGAERAYRGAVEVNADPFFDSLLDYNYGRFLLKQKRLEESRPLLDRAVARLPDSRAARYERGKLNLALRDYEAARQDAEAALGLRDPRGLVLDLQLYYLLATIYTRLGESDLARKYAELSRTTQIPNQD